MQEEQSRVNKLYDQFISALYANDHQKAEKIVTNEARLTDKFFRFSLDGYEIDGINFLLSRVTLTKKDIETAVDLGYRNNNGVVEDAYYAIYLDMQTKYAAQQKTALSSAMSVQVSGAEIKKPGCH